MLVEQAAEVSAKLSPPFSVLDSVPEPSHQSSLRGRAVAHSPAAPESASHRNSYLQAYCNDREIPGDRTRSLMQGSTYPSNLTLTSRRAVAASSHPARIRTGLPEHLHRDDPFAPQVDTDSPATPTQAGLQPSAS